MKNGQQLEQMFYKWLMECQPCHMDNKEHDKSRTPFNGDHNIFTHFWLSRGKRDAPMDFWCIVLPDVNEIVYFDVVDSREKGNSIELNTGHKDWKAILAYCKEHTKELSVNSFDSAELTFKAYIVFSPTSGQADDWKFIGIHERLPTGGIYLSKERIKHVWGYDAVFGKPEHWVLDEQETFKDASGHEFKLSCKIRTKEHSKRCREFVEYLKTHKFEAIPEYV